MTDKIKSEGIQVTRNYDKFSYILGNRDILTRHVANLAQSILNKNMLAQNPIIVNEDYKIIDGQHRLEVARNNDLDIYYIVVPGANLKEIITLNSYSKIWNSKDYINSYAKQGNKNFIWLNYFMEKYAISISTALLLLFSHEGEAVRTSIKRGKLTITEAQKELGEKRADVLWDIRPYMIRPGFTPRGFLKALIEIINKDLEKKLIAGIKSKGESFIPETNQKEALTQLLRLCK